MGKNYFIIHSIKGGCGKSSVSLFTGLLLSMKEKNTIIVDCDLSASATHKLYAPTDGGSENNIKLMNMKLKDYALNELLRGDVIDIDDIINSIYFNWNLKGGLEKPNNMELDYIFAHSEKSKLSDFRFNVGANRANNIPIGLFNNKFDELLSLIKVDERYQNVIFDLAASSNEYSYIIYRHLLELHDDKNKMYLVLVTTSDRAHLEETMQYLKEVAIGTTDKPRFDNIIIIINSLANYAGESAYKECCDKINQMITKAKLGDTEYLKYVHLPFQESYFELTHSSNMKALNDLDMTGYLEVLDEIMKKGK